MYTIGSTGLPKGVMMTRANVLATVSSVITIVPSLGSQDSYLAYLPLAHILELAAENLIAAVGASIGYGSPLTLTDTSNKMKKGTRGDAVELSPTIMTAVPAILDLVRDGDGVQKNVDSKGVLSKVLFNIAYSRRLSAVNGNWFGARGPERMLWNLLVFRKVKAILGGRVRFILSGGAPLSADTQRFINTCLGSLKVTDSQRPVLVGRSVTSMIHLLVGLVRHCLVHLLSFHRQRRWLGWRGSRSLRRSSLLPTPGLRKPDWSRRRSSSRETPSRRHSPTNSTSYNTADREN